MTRRSRSYTSEFKIEAVDLSSAKSQYASAAARSVGIAPALLRSWKIAFQGQGADAFPGNGRLNPHEEEIRRLRAENRRLLMEREVLKKATAFFAREAT